MWFRRDLRLSDNPALAGRRPGGTVGPAGGWCPLFCLDDVLRAAVRRRPPRVPVRVPDGAGRVARRAPRGSVRAHPVRSSPRVAAEVGADGRVPRRGLRPYGRERDDAVGRGAGRQASRSSHVRRLALRRAAGRGREPATASRTRCSRRSRGPGGTTGGRARRRAGGVAWLGVPARRPTASRRRRRSTPSCPSRARPPPSGPPAASGTPTSTATTTARDRPGDDATSPPVALPQVGLHPPPPAAQPSSGRSAAHETFRTELCWREFYADVLWHRPDTVRQAFVPAMRTMEVDTRAATDDAFRAWAEGRTGYPIVDAGMRQLLRRGLDAQPGAHDRRQLPGQGPAPRLDPRRPLVHAATWSTATWPPTTTAGSGWPGTGTDAAPYFRVFNPTSPGRELRPGRRLRAPVRARAALRPAARRSTSPWTLAGGPPPGYPEPIVDHADERAEALRRYDAVARVSRPRVLTRSVR